LKRKDSSRSINTNDITDLGKISEHKLMGLSSSESKNIKDEIESLKQTIEEQKV
jgi:hypothetical protein